jgi:hypothetical protein
MGENMNGISSQVKKLIDKLSYENFLILAGVDSVPPLIDEEDDNVEDEDEHS